MLPRGKMVNGIVQRKPIVQPADAIASSQQRRKSNA
jgi:hypothetical protein